MKKIFTLLALAAAGFTAQAQHSIYIQNLSDWATVKLYAWNNDGDQIMGTWSGAEASSTETINGVSFLKFDTPASANGTTHNFIANDGIDGGSQFDLAAITLDKDYYYAINGKKAVEVDPENPGDVKFTSNTYSIYVDDQSGWSSLNIYAWSTGNPELFGSWPGYQTPGSVVIDGTTYKTYPMEESSAKYNLIFNGDGNQFNGPTISVDRDYYFKVTSSSYEELATPGTTTYHIYVDNQTGWHAFYIYSWNEYTDEIFGGWSGTTSSTTETIKEVEYLVFTYTGVENGTANLIFHNNAGTQYDALTITLDRDWYIRAESDKAINVGDTSAVEAIAAENVNAAVEYFNLQGVRVEDPTNGLYIRRQGTNVAKVLVK